MNKSTDTEKSTSAEAVVEPLKTEKTKKAVKAKTAKAASKTVKKTTAKVAKADKAEKPVKAVKPKKTAKADKSIKITLVKSIIGRKPKHISIVKQLGLGKLNSSVVQHDIPAIRGLINQVYYLVQVEECA